MGLLVVHPGDQFLAGRTAFDAGVEESVEVFPRRTRGDPYLFRNTTVIHR